MAQERRRFQIHVDHSHQFLRAALLERPSGVIAGVVDENIHPTEPFLRPLQHRSHGVRIRHIGGDHQRSVGPDPAGNGLEGLFTPGHKNDPSPLGSELSCGRRSDPG